MAPGDPCQVGNSGLDAKGHVGLSSVSSSILSANSPPVDDTKTPNEILTSKEEEGKNSEVTIKTDTENFDSEGLSLPPPAPIRPEFVANAVSFLSHPKVKGSPVRFRRQFLEKKGLTAAEINEAFRQVPDAPPNDTPPVSTAASESTASPPSSSHLALPPSPSPSLHPTSPLPRQHPTSNIAAQPPIVPPFSAPPSQPVPFPGPAVAPPMGPPADWRKVAAVSVLLGAGGAALATYITRVGGPPFRQWLKAWASSKREEERVKEGNDEVGKSGEDTRLEEKSELKEVSQHLAELLREMKEERERERERARREQEEREAKGIEGEVGEQITVADMKRELRSFLSVLSEFRPESVAQKDTSSPLPPPFSSDSHFDYNKSAKHKKDYPYGQSNAGSGSWQEGSERRRVPPPPDDAPPHSKSFQEIMEMVKRGETPPGIKEVNDKPPNPNQRPSTSQLSALPKPWEKPAASSSNPTSSFPSTQSYGSQNNSSYGNPYGSSYGKPYRSQSNDPFGNPYDFQSNNPSKESSTYNPYGSPCENAYGESYLQKSVASQSDSSSSPVYSHPSSFPSAPPPTSFLPSSLPSSSPSFSPAEIPTNDLSLGMGGLGKGENVGASAGQNAGQFASYAAGHNLGQGQFVGQSSGQLTGGFVTQSPGELTGQFKGPIAGQGLGQFTGQDVGQDVGQNQAASVPVSAPVLPPFSAAPSNFSTTSVPSYASVLSSSVLSSSSSSWTPPSIPKTFLPEAKNAILPSNPTSSSLPPFPPLSSSSSTAPPSHTLSPSPSPSSSPSPFPPLSSSPVTGPASSLPSPSLLPPSFAPPPPSVTPEVPLPPSLPSSLAPPSLPSGFRAGENMTPPALSSLPPTPPSSVQIEEVTE